MLRLKYDLHIHSCLSPCGSEDMTPNNIAGMAMLNGVQLAALTDHNTTKNCPAFFAACRNVGIIPVAGMELTTQEEIHLVCLFPDLESAMNFDSFVDGHRLKIKNKVNIFGEQLVLNENDEIIEKEEYLLITATDLEISDAVKAVFDHGGAVFPAHIDKQANSIIAILGTFPEYIGFSSAEIHNESSRNDLLMQFPVLKKILIISDSDSHMLDSFPLDPPSLDLDCDGNGEDAVRKALIKKLRGSSK